MHEHNIGFLLLFGISIFGGIATALLFSKIKMPQVIGYIVTGVVIGASGFGLISSQHITSLQPFNYFALGIIGFLVGSEIKFSDIKKYGKQFSLILILEGVLAFLLVGTAVFLVLFHVTASFAIAAAGGVVFGAIASATDPASTVNVIWEYRAAGILTTTIIAIVALDDALAMLLYGFGTSVSRILVGGGSSVTLELLTVCAELFISAGLGVLWGYILVALINRVRVSDTLFVFGFGLLLILMGVCVYFDLDVILASMAAGITVENVVPEKSKRLIEQIKALSTPIYILFFVLVGARMAVGSMPSWLWIIVVLYVLLRSAGKYFGSYLGAKFSGADEKVVRYTGMSIFAQGGVAIGLSIMASHHLSHITVVEGISLGEVIIFGVTTTTLIVQVIGPLAVKYALRFSGEAGKNITIDDLLNTWLVEKYMGKLDACVKPNSTIRQVMDNFINTDAASLVVIDEDEIIKGIIPFSNVKMLLSDQSMWDWLIAADFIVPAKNHLAGTERVSDALALMEQLDKEELPVVHSDGKVVGLFNRYSVLKEARVQLIAHA